MNSRIKRAERLLVSKPNVMAEKVYPDDPVLAIAIASR